MTAETSQTLDRGLRVLKLLADTDHGLTVTELSHNSGEPDRRVPVARHAGAARIVRRDLGGRARVGLGVLRLGRQVHPLVREAALPALRSLAEDIGATAHLTLVDGAEALAVAVVEPSWTDYHLMRAGTASSPSTPATDPGPASGPGAGSGGRSGTQTAAQGMPAAGGRSSGWPVMTPPDLPARPAPRAPLTDVVPRRTLVIIAVVVVLAVLGAVLAFVLGGDDESGQGAKGSGGDKAVASGTPSADTRGDESDGTRTDGTATGSADAGAGSAAGTPGTGDGGSDDPDGSDDPAEDEGGTSAEETYEGNQGYSIGLPEGWKYQSTGSAGDRFTGPDGQRLLVAWTSTPKDDPVADWKNQERYMVRSQYKRIRIEEVGYRGWNAADWEFTYVENGTKYRTVDRGFVVDDRLGYALMYTAKAAQWGDEQRRETWRTLTKSFEPKS
ncbi:hypothetical protein SGRIM128S_03201 [Streptomyces griseomycini]